MSSAFSYIIAAMSYMAPDSPYYYNLQSPSREQILTDIQEYQDILYFAKCVIKNEKLYNNPEIQETIYYALIDSDTPDIFATDSGKVLAKKLKAKLEHLIALKALLLRLSKEN